jgi:hypothetical protein
MPIRITRRGFAALAGGFLVSPKAIAQSDTPLITRAIPSPTSAFPQWALARLMFSIRMTKRHGARPMPSYRL